MNLISPCPDTPAPSPPLRSLVGYLAEWDAFQGERPAFLDLPLQGVTHLLYSFARVAQNSIQLRNARVASEIPFQEGQARKLRGGFGQLVLLKEKYPHLTILLSLAGGARGFAKAAATATDREEFAHNVIRFLRRWPVFDGLDLDWEFPVAGRGSENFIGDPTDKFHFTKLMKTLRHALQQEECRQGRRYSLTIAVGSRKDHIRSIEPYELSKWVDFMTIMTYDFPCYDDQLCFWPPIFSYHNAPLYEDPAGPNSSACFQPKSQNVAAAMLRYLRAGVLPRCLHMGLPFYGRQFLGCAPRHQGEYQACADKQLKAPALTYQEILTQYKDKKHVRSYFNPRSLVPFLFCEESKNFVSYDDACSLCYKVEWAHRYCLGGLSIWHLTGDDKQSTLLHAVSKAWQSEGR